MLLLAIKASLVLAFAFGVTGLLRRASASSRHVVWLATFVGVLALPVGSMLLPTLSLTLPFLHERVPAPAAVLADESGLVAAARADRLLAELSAERATVAAVKKPGVRKAALAAEASLAAAAEVARAPMAAAPAQAGSAWPWTLRLFLLWMFGFVMVAVAFAVGVLRTHLVACAALPASDMLAEEAEALAESLGIARAVRVVTWPGPAMPMTWGARTPVVLLPQDAADWPASRRREVLTHELAHVRRGDWLARLLAASVCALHWFNPLVWMAARRMRDEQELACDDAVLAGGVRPSDYAAHLLEVARGLRTPRGVGQAAVAMARPSQLSDRLLAVLETTRTRASAPSSSRLAWLGVFAFAIPLAAAVPGAAAPQYPKPARAPRAAIAPFAAVASGVKGGVAAGVAPLAPVTASSDAPVVAAVAGSGGGRCPEVRRTVSSGNHSHTTSSSSNSSSSDDATPRRTTLSIREGDCFIEIRIVGNVSFSNDESEVTDVPRNASVRVWEEGDGPDRLFDASWRDGQLQRRWFVNDVQAGETDELRAWLATALRTTFARTGFNAIPRALRAYRAGGLDSTIGLAEASGSDYSRRIMLMALIDSVRIPASDAARIARQAQSMSSDYERAELLIAVATRVGLDGAVQDAMTASAAGMSSDYERRRVLSAALARQGLTSQSARALLNTAELMSSDYEKAELLIGYIGKQSFADDRRAAFFAAAGSIRSDYEHHRVLTAGVDRADTPASIVGEVAAQAEHLRSDYERAELLIHMVDRFGSNADARTHIRRAADSISSDYEKQRVQAALGRMQ